MLLLINSTSDFLVNSSIPNKIGILTIVGLAGSIEYPLLYTSNISNDPETQGA